MHSPHLTTPWIFLLMHLNLPHLKKITLSLPHSPPTFFSPSPYFSFSPSPSYLLTLLSYPLLFLFLPSSFISPHSDFPLPLAAGLHSLFVGSIHLMARTLSIYLMAAWITACSALLSSPPCIKALRQWDYCYPPSYVCSTSGPLHKPLHSKVMYSLSVLDQFGSHDKLRILQEVVTGIERGQLHGIPWQALPLTRSFVKERLAFAAFSNCHCIFTSALWLRGSGSGINSTLFGSQRHILGCNCSEWQEGAVGTLAYSGT